MEWALYDAVQFVAVFFGFEAENENFSEKRTELQDWDFLNKYEANNLEKQRQIVDLHIYDEKILQHLPRPRILDWEKEGIEDEVSVAYGIAYNPRSNGIVIPHWDILDRLVGIRERTLVQELAKYGKYRPSILNGVM